MSADTSPERTEPTTRRKVTRTGGILTMDVAKKVFQKYIAFSPVFADMAGNATAGLLLSQLFHWTGITSDPDGWIYKTQQEWTEETRLTRWEQETARKRLRTIGVLEEVKKGLPSKLFYRINVDVFTDLLNHQLGIHPDHDPDEGAGDLKERSVECGNPTSLPELAGNPPTGMMESHAQVCGNPSSLPVGKPHLYNSSDETADETTDKTTTTGGVAAGGGVDDLSDQKNGAEIDAIVEKLDSFKTGLAKSIIRELVMANPAHGKLWSEHWGAAKESRDEYWAGQEDKRAGTLRIRLSKLDRLPASIIARQQAQERRNGREHAQRESKAAERQRIAKERESEGQSQKETVRVWSEYSTLPKAHRAEVDRIVSEERQAVARIVRDRGGIDNLDQTSVAFRDYMDGVRQVMADIAAAEKAAEMDDEGEEIEALEVDVSAIIENQIERFVQAGKVEWEGWMNYSDAEKTHISSEVEQRLKAR